MSITAAVVARATCFKYHSIIAHTSITHASIFNANIRIEVVHTNLLRGCCCTVAATTEFSLKVGVTCRSTAERNAKKLWVSMVPRGSPRRNAIP